MKLNRQQLESILSQLDYNCTRKESEVEQWERGQITVKMYGTDDVNLVRVKGLLKEQPYSITYLMGEITASNIVPVLSVKRLETIVSQ